MGKSDLPKKLLTFLLKDQEYGINLDYVQEIVRWRPTTKLPGTPCYICGAMPLRGDIIPVMDLNLRINNESLPINAYTVVIIISLGSKKGGLIATSATNIINVEEGDMIDDFSLSQDHLLHQTYRKNGRVIPVLSLETINRDFYTKPSFAHELREVVNE